MRPQLKFGKKGHEGRGRGGESLVWGIPRQALTRRLNVRSLADSMLIDVALAEVQERRL
jgi:hypothetical protein